MDGQEDGTWKVATRTALWLGKAWCSAMTIEMQGQTPPQVFVRPEDDPKPLPKIVLSQAPGGRSPPMNRAGSGGGPNSPPPQVCTLLEAVCNLACLVYCAAPQLFMCASQLSLQTG